MCNTELCFFFFFCQVRQIEQRAKAQREKKKKMERKIKNEEVTTHVWPIFIRSSA